MNIYGQECKGPLSGNRNDHPKNEVEWETYTNCVMRDRIKEDLIQKNFAEAELVVEGTLIESRQGDKANKKIYQIEPYTIFKGSIPRGKIIEIIADIDTTADFKDIGSWENHPFPKGVFFVKKNQQKSNFYEFINNTNAWIAYNFFIDPIYREKQLKTIVHNKITIIEGAKYQKTSFFYKKKEQLGSLLIINSTPVINALSRDTIPAGFLVENRSILTIYGTDLGTVLKPILLLDANVGGNSLFSIHPIKHILNWNNDSIQIIIPSMGYIDSELNIDGRKSCAGSGYIKILYDPITPIYSPETEDFIVPYAIKNFATNDANELTYTPYELRLRAANGSGGYTIAYDNSFSNHPNALEAFRRALETWRCAARVDFKELCNANNSFCTEDISANTIIVSFKKPCLTYAGGALGKTTITNPTVGCNGNFFTDKMSMIFKDSTSMLPYKWNFSNNANTDTAEFNFEAVATHELGHLLMLGHVLDTTALMYWEGKHGIGAIANNTEPDSSALTAIRYIMGRDSVTTPDCPTQPLLPKSCGGGKTQDETPCFVDLRMRDNNWDTGQEPNYSAGVDVDGGGWSATSPADWEDIWNSPDLWNCKEVECQPENWHNPIAVLPNKLGFTIYNAHPDIVSDEAKLHLYYTMASTGEMWK